MQICFKGLSKKNSKSYQMCGSMAILETMRTIKIQAKRSQIELSWSHVIQQKDDDRDDDEE